MTVSVSITTLLQHLLFLFLLLIAPRSRRHASAEAEFHIIGEDPIRRDAVYVAMGFHDPGVRHRRLAIARHHQSLARGDGVASFAHLGALHHGRAVYTRGYHRVDGTHFRLGMPACQLCTGASADAMQKASYAYLFPITRAERRWWVLVGVTAHRRRSPLRGFLLHYLQQPPWQLSLTLALLVSSLIFAFQDPSGRAGCHRQRDSGCALWIASCSAAASCFLCLARSARPALAGDSAAGD